MSITYYLTGPGKETLASEELSRHRVHGCEHIAPGVLRSQSKLPADRPACLAFTEQTLQNCQPIAAESISQWAKAVVESAEETLSSSAHPWRLHVLVLSEEPLNRRAELIRTGIREYLGEKRRSLAKRLVDSTLPLQSSHEVIVQVGLLSKSEGVISAQVLDAAVNEHILSCFEGGRVDFPEDKQPPSRAYRKLVEAELRAGRRIRPDELCVDLGASPGGWTAIALQRGASVIAVDRSPLREDLMSHPKLTFIRGDGFSYDPDKPVDWMLCDIIAYPERSLQLLETWLSEKRCKHLCLTLKFQGQTDFSVIEQAEATLSMRAQRYFIKALNNNKNEVTVWAQGIP